jgi:hypothetical protein
MKLIDFDPPPATVVASARWLFRHWRARHAWLEAKHDFDVDPSPYNREALARARRYLDRVELNRP